MSKSKKVKYDMTPYNNYIKYLQNYDTSAVDRTLNDLSEYARNSAAQNLTRMGDYTFGVEGSDAARQRAENATYNAYLERLMPQFEQRRSDLATSLQNKGLSVGSEAYERAMNDFDREQNNALNQAAYTSVLNGQDAFSQSLNDEINAGQFGNTAQQAYINQLLSALTGSASGYENAQNLFNVGTGRSNLQYEQDKANAKGGWQGALIGALEGAGAGYASTGSPWGALGGGLSGAYSAYQTNPYGSYKWR